MADRETLLVYGAKAEDYAATVADQSGDPQLQTFIAALPKDARVLDLGCGPGLSAKQMMDAGLTVDATDASPEMVAMARKLGVSAECSVFSDLSAEDTYDGVWANFSLLHAPKSDMPKHLAQIHGAMRAGGLFHIGVKTGEGEHRDTLGRFYAYYEARELMNLLRDAGFTTEDSDTGVGRGLSGSYDPWIVVRARA